MTNTENTAASPELDAVVAAAKALDAAVISGEPRDITTLVQAYGDARNTAQDAGHSLDAIEAATAGALN